MKSLILLSTILLTACGPEKEKDKDGVAPRLVSLNIQHEPEPDAYFIVLEGRVSTETVDQFIAYEISASLSEDEMPESCTSGDDVHTFYQQERIEVNPESKYYIVACSINKHNGSISETMSKTVRTEELAEDPDAEAEEEYEDAMNEEDDSQIPFCEREPNHVLCTESTDLCVRQPDLCLVTP
jgi:hypothetical protein